MSNAYNIMKPTLLLVDDNEPLLRLLKSIFDKQFTVFTANDGVEALDILSKGIRPRLILSDVQMANIDGYELVAHLSTSKLYKDIPVILMTGSKQPIDVPQGGNVARILYKPFDPVTLHTEVNAVLAETKNGLRPGAPVTGRAFFMASTTSKS
jgi:two-component system, chemotaxis family, chemotaxis protein CheY